MEGQEANRYSVAPPPFFTMPSWWRRFIFHTLTHRDFAVYCFLCCLIDKNAMAFPTQSQIGHEVGLEKDTVIKSVRKLHNFGFMLRKLRQLPRTTTSSRRTIYQRPAPEFTLLRLLSLGAIDANLYPTKTIGDKTHDERDTSESAVSVGLRNLLGPQLFAEFVPDDLDNIVRLLQQRFFERTGRLYEDALVDLEMPDGKSYRPER